MILKSLRRGYRTEKSRYRRVCVAKGEFVALLRFFVLLLKGMKVDFKGETATLARNLEELSASKMKTESDSLSFEDIEKAATNSFVSISRTED
jgi:hypothetical protein